MALTVIEQRTLELIQSACKKFISSEINWEQRRYEVAKELYANNEMSASEAISQATEFINKLKDVNNGIN